MLWYGVLRTYVGNMRDLPLVRFSPQALPLFAQYSWAWPFSDPPLIIWESWFVKSELSHPWTVPRLHGMHLGKHAHFSLPSRKPCPGGFINVIIHPKLAALIVPWNLLLDHLIRTFVAHKLYWSDQSKYIVSSLNAMESMEFVKTLVTSYQLPRNHDSIFQHRMPSIHLALALQERCDLWYTQRMRNRFGFCQYIPLLRLSPGALPLLQGSRQQKIRQRLLP